MFHGFSRWLTIALLTVINLRIGLSVSNVYAQPAEEPVPGYVVESRTTRDGLPQNMIRSLLQTRDGYLWIGASNAGLARFDGVAFVAFYTTNTPALPSNSISALHEDVKPCFGSARPRDSLPTVTVRLPSNAPSTGRPQPARTAVVSDAAGQTWIASDAHTLLADAAIDGPARGALSWKGPTVTNSRFVAWRVGCLPEQPSWAVLVGVAVAESGYPQASGMQNFRGGLRGTCHARWRGERR